MPDLQKWQTQLLKVNDLDKFQVFAKKIQRLTDGGVSKKAQPESYKEIVKAAQAIADSLTAMGAGSPEKQLHEHAGSAELQVYMAKYRRLVQLLLPYWQGKSVTDCDAGAAIEIQEHIDGMRSARLYMDFENSRYFLEGSEVTLEEAFASGIVDFTRLSKAWQFVGGKLEEYDVNEPRFSGKGLLVEHSTTNYAIRTKTPTTETWCQASGAFSSRYIESNDNGLFTAKNSRDEINNWGIYSSINTTNKDKVKYVGFGVHSYMGKDTLRVSVNNPTSYAMLNFNTKEHSIVGSQTVGSYLLGDVFLGEFNTLNSVAESYTGGIGDSVTYFGIFAVDSLTYSPIPTDNAPVTRLPETLTVRTDSNFTIEADEGIQVNGNEITGFGYIRKLEVK